MKINLVKKEVFKDPKIQIISYSPGKTEITLDLVGS